MTQRIRALVVRSGDRLGDKEVGRVLLDGAIIIIEFVDGTRDYFHGADEVEVERYPSVLRVFA